MLRAPPAPAMKVDPSGPSRFSVEFESVEELRAEEKAHLAMGGLLLPVTVSLPSLARIELNLSLAGHGTATAIATVVATPPGAIALHLEGDSTALVAALLEPAIAPESEESETDKATLWDRLRRLTPPQRILLAPRADRMTRMLLVQDKDPQVLLALLKNPRLSVDEVVRIAKSSHLFYQSIDLILKTPLWMANLDVRVGLIHSPKTPLALALRILPTLPDAEVRVLAKGAAPNNALRQAALRKVQGGEP